MSVVRVAVPVLHGKRRFHFDKGRPWSVLEHIILGSLTAKRMSAAEIAKKGDIPQQIVVEALIRLMRAGWVQMRQEDGKVLFEPTLQGTATATLQELPNIPRRLSKNMNFVIDQVTGTVYRSRQLPFVHTWVVEERAAKEPVVWIHPPDEPKGEEVRPLVEALFQDDEKFISMDQDGGRLMERWALITVRDGEPERLPPGAPQALRDIITEAAKHARRPRAEAEDRVSVASPVPRIGRSAVLPPDRPINLLPNDLVLGGMEHAETLKSALRRARHRVIIHSTFIGNEQFAALEADFRAALERGARIDILWGQDVTTEGVRSTRQVVGALRQSLAAKGVDRLVIHPFSTRSHSKILVADDGSIGKLVAWIGSCNWLSSNFQNFEASVRLRDPWLVSDVLDQLAELSRGSSGHWTTLTSELAALAANLDPGRVPQTPKASAAIIFGGRHAELMRTARDLSTRNLFVTSHRFGAAGGPAVLVPVAAAAKAKNVDVQLYYGIETTQGYSTNRARAELREAGIEPQQREHFHAKLLAWDDDWAVVTSQNWLSADPADDNPRQEIGVYLNAPGVARTLVDRFNMAAVGGHQAAAIRG